MQRPSYFPETRAYWADLDNIGRIYKWTPRILYINLIGVIYLLVGFFVLFKQGGRAPYALHFATLCLAAFVSLFYTSIGAYDDLDLAVGVLDSIAFISSRHYLFTSARCIQPVNSSLQLIVGAPCCLCSGALPDGSYDRFLPA
jgi:hypothetical protein